jgi:hypothetical protein
MGGKGGTVQYSKYHRRKPSKAEKTEIKGDVAALIDGATAALTVIVLVTPSPGGLKKTSSKKKRRKT